jgi:hypothetical protein
MGKKNKNPIIRKKKFKYKDGDYFEVERICGKKEEQGKTLYNVKWLGWDTSTNTWEPIEKLLNVKHLVREYEQSTNNKGIINFNKDFFIESESDEINSSLYEDVRGDFKTDIPLMIRKLEHDGIRYLATVEWCVRKNGIKPTNTKIDRDIIKFKVPKLLIEYYEKKIRWLKE